VPPPVIADHEILRELETVTGKLLGEAAVVDLADDLGLYIHAGTGRALVLDDRRATVVDLAAHKPVGEPVVHGQRIWFGRLSADGTRAITIDAGAVGKVCEVATGRAQDLAVGYGWRPLDAAVNGRGEVAVAFYDGQIGRCRLADGKPVESSFHKVGSEGWRPRFDADAVFLTGLTEEAARVWEVDGAQPFTPALRHGGAVTCSAFAAEGRRLLVGTDDGSLRVWDLASARAEVPLIGIWNGVPRRARVETAADGACLVLGEGRLLRFARGQDLQGGGAPATPVEPSAPTTVLSPDGTRLAVGTSHGVVRLLDAATLRDVVPPLHHARRFVLDIAFTPDGRRLATRDADGEAVPDRFLGEVHLWDVASGKELPTTLLRLGNLLELGGVCCLALSPDGGRLALGGGRITLGGVRGEIRLHEAATGKPVGKSLPVTPGSVPVQLAFSPDGRRLAAVSLAPPTTVSGELTLWDVEAGKLVLPPIRFPLPPLWAVGEWRAFAFDPSGHGLAVACGKAVQVWDPAEGKCLHLLPHRDGVTAVQYQQAGQVLLSVSEGETAHAVHLWDAATGEALRPPIRNRAPVASAALAFGGRFLVTASDRDWDRSLRFWDLAPGPGQGAERQRLARLLSCQEIGGTAALPARAEDLAADWEHLHRRAPDLLRPLEVLVGSWHEQQADRLVNAQAWAAAARQYDLILARQPTNPSWWHYAAGGCCLAAGDRAGLRRHAEELLRQNSQATSLDSVDWTVKSCLIVPDTMPDPAAALRLAERLEKAAPGDPHYPWLVVSRGLALYLAGRPGDAAAWLARAHAVKDKPSACTVLADVFLALALTQQGQADEARRLLAEARGLTSALEEGPGAPAGLTASTAAPPCGRRARRSLPAEDGGVPMTEKPRLEIDLNRAALKQFGASLEKATRPASPAASPGRRLTHGEAAANKRRLSALSGGSQQSGHDPAPGEVPGGSRRSSSCGEQAAAKEGPPVPASCARTVQPPVLALRRDACHGDPERPGSIPARHLAGVLRPPERIQDRGSPILRGDARGSRRSLVCAGLGGAKHGRARRPGAAPGSEVYLRI
jgi:WD40 repeat protein